MTPQAKHKLRFMEAAEVKGVRIVIRKKIRRAIQAHACPPSTWGIADMVEMCEIQLVSSKSATLRSKSAKLFLDM